MAATTIQKVSRLRYSTLWAIGGYTFFSDPDLTKILPADDDLTHQVIDSDRLDLLANKYYGAPDLWWVIAQVNGMRLLPRDLKVGSMIRIPTRGRVLTKFLPSSGI